MTKVLIVGNLSFANANGPDYARPCRHLPELSCSGKAERSALEGALMQSKTTSVFVVDDQRLTSSNVAGILLAMGLAAESFLSPYQALIAVARNAPELIIWDVTMPLMAEVRLVECVNLRYPYCFSILISGQVIQAAASLPSARIVPSPLNPQVLFAAMEELGISLDLPESMRASSEEGASKRNV